MDEFEREDMLADATYDAQNTDYTVKVTVQFTYPVSARTRLEAESEAYDAIKTALRGSYLDYDFEVFETEKLG